MSTILSVPFADTSAEELTFSLEQARLPEVSSTVVPLGPATPGAERAGTVGSRATDGSAVRQWLELNVLGCSHQVIHVADGQDSLVETLACVPGRDASLPVSVSTTAPDSGHRHHFVSRVDRLSTEEFDAAVQQVLRDAAAHEHNCVARFPGEEGSVTALALTTLTPDRWAWRTWHCYPQYGQIVFTRTTVDTPSTPLEPVVAGDREVCT